MSYLEKAQDLSTKIGSGQVMDALEQYYAENCKIIEADGTIRNSKDEQREAIKQWQTQMVKEVHDGGVNSITSNEDAEQTCIESWMDITFQDGNRMKFEEVAVQNWVDGQIVQERFYYNPGPGAEQQ